MTQDQVITFCFKVIDVTALVTIVAFVAYYSTIAQWYRNPVGRTIVLKDIALALILVPSALNLFLHFNELSSHIAAWFDVASFGAVPVIMVWRIIVWRRIHKAGMLQQDSSSGGV
jgi:hypothetical protein